jgi:hypothetical protein
MAASEHINKQLFHGSDHLFKPGDLITPQKNEDGAYPDAFAADNKDLATFFGKHLFAVEPIDHEQTYSRPYDQRVEEMGHEFHSPVGFKVTEKLGKHVPFWA